MTNASPEGILPPTGEETRESDDVGRVAPSGDRDPAARPESGAAADRLLPPFFPDIWEPDAYDEVVLEWWGEAYLLECGSIHWWDDGGHHEHGEVLALVIVVPEDLDIVDFKETLQEAQDEEDWVEECIALAGV